jgi:hypothetical protein
VKAILLLAVALVVLAASSCGGDPTFTRQSVEEKMSLAISTPGRR